MKLFSKDQTVVALILGLAIFFIGLSRPFHPFLPTLKSSGNNPTTGPDYQYVIEVEGDVKNAGIYLFDNPPTPYQAIQKAGGPIDEHRLLFHMPDNTLDTGTRLELKSTTLSITSISTGKRLVLGIPIELNKANVEDLAIIPGISHGLAQRIVEFRELNGPFRMYNELQRVKGIGPKNIERFRSYLSLN
ncbi:MAG: helix-hairpin-helix domain-containing protein [Desulfobacterales bacterium]|nr:helix-hairpin-helix domain-containing protein [Desulfobacterales bacterium]